MIRANLFLRQIRRLYLYSLKLL